MLHRRRCRCCSATSGSNHGNCVVGLQGSCDTSQRERPPTSQDRLLDPDHREHRRRLWRHRYEPPLRLPRVRDRGGRGERGRGSRNSWRALADLLGADRCRHAEIRAHPHAGRQPRGGWHPCPHGASPAGRRPVEHAGCLSRHRRRGAFLRRRDVDTSLVRALGGGGAPGRGAEPRRVRPAAFRR